MSKESREQAGPAGTAPNGQRHAVAQQHALAGCAVRASGARAPTARQYARYNALSLQIADGQVYSLGSVDTKGQTDTSYWLGPVAEGEVQIIESAGNPGFGGWANLGTISRQLAGAATALLVFSNGATTQLGYSEGGLGDMDVQGAKIEAVQYNAVAHAARQAR